MHGQVKSMLSISRQITPKLSEDTVNTGQVQTVLYNLIYWNLAVESSSQRSASEDSWLTIDADFQSRFPDSL